MFGSTNWMYVFAVIGGVIAVWRIWQNLNKLRQRKNDSWDARLIDQLRECLEARVLAHANKKRIEAGDRNPFEIVDHLIAHVLGQRAVRRMRAGNDQERITVRLAARHGLGGKAAGDAGLGLDDDRLACRRSRPGIAVLIGRPAYWLRVLEGCVL